MVEINIEIGLSMGMNEKFHLLTTLLVELNEIGSRHGVG
jgi:argininosuccinate synthase